jgi:hypothetical protein
LKYGIEIGQVYVPADGSSGQLKVIEYQSSTDEVLVLDSLEKGHRYIDAFKLAKVRYMLKEKK